MALHEFPVEASHIMMFARAVGDPNPVYHDAEYATGTEVGGIIAPPTFVTAGAQFDLTYPMRPTPGQPWFGSGKNPTGTPDRQRNNGGTGLHAEQHYEYLKPLRPGQRLTVRSRDGDTWTKAGRRGGSLTFKESITEYVDEAGEIVLRARGVVVRTEHPVESE